MSNWLPIESAPEKVEVILAWTWEGADPIIRTGKMAWKPFGGDPPVFLMEIDYGDAATSIYTTKSDPPTHWQPLPAPPSV